MGDHTITGDAALIRAVRGLDNGDADTTPDRLERVWDTLEGRDRQGSFHAAEEMLLRWLLKNMTGTSANAEHIRRYPRVWDILGAVFALIPLFSLAKSLADRRFVAILQQTLKDIATPQQDTGAGSDEAQKNGTDSDVDMADAPPLENPTNPRKRKRTNPASFDAATQRQAPGCLQTAHALFESIRILLARCETKSLDGPATNRMGAEHVKSLFSSPAAEAMPIVAPWLTICGLAAESPRGGAHGEQSAWISTVASLWELHLQSAADASEVATHLSGTATRLLGKLTGIPQRISLGIEPTVQDRWARDLRRFLTRNLVLPARATFLTAGSKGVVQLAVDMSAPSAQITFPVLFDLVSKSPPGVGSATSRKDYDTWVQTVFDAIMHASKNINTNNRSVAMRAIMEMAAERGAALSASSLRVVCKDYALQKDAYDWSLLLSLVKLNSDVFLISEDGKQLLEQVLEKTKQPDSLSEQDLERAAQFIVLLASGYAQARDLSSFVKVWLTHVAPTKPKAGLQPLWAQKELSDTVGKLVQTSLNTNQLVEVIDWLSSQAEPTQSMARIFILDAISSGISQEESVDAANIKTFDSAFLEKFSKKELPIISACRWMVASKAISRGTLEEAGRIWSEIKSDIKSILRKSPIDREDTFAAFRCCAAAWLANHPGAPDEDDAAALICSFVEKLEQDDEPMELDSSSSTTAINKGTYVSWILSDAPRLLSLLVEKNGCIPKGVLSLITVPGKEDTGRVETALQASRLLLDRESSLNNQKLTDLLIESVTSTIAASKPGKPGPQTKIAIQFLLDIPSEALGRSQREAAMKSLISHLHLPGESDKAKSANAEYWKLVLSLMVKLMARPTFYEDMGFADLDSIGQCLVKASKRSSRRSSSGPAAEGTAHDRDNLKLLQQLAVSTIRQMASGSPEERERTYLKAAASLLQAPCQDSEVAARIVLLHAFLSTVQASPALKKLQANGLELDGLKSHLLQVALPAVTSKKRTGKGLLGFLVALEALSDLDRAAVKDALSDKVSSLIEASDALLESRAQAGWEVRMFVANHFPEALGSPLKVNMAVEAQEHTDEAVEDEAESGESAAALGKTALLQYVDAVVRSVDEDTKLGYLQELLVEGNAGQDATGRVLAIYRVIQHLKGSRPSTAGTFDLAQAHSLLCARLQQTSTNPALFPLTTHAIRLLLDQNASCMTQWNIEVTLSTVSILSSTAPLPSAVLFPPLARLTETVIKRHRRRLDGHFHLLLTALQALLRLLLSPSPNAPPAAEKHARLFSRLLTLICEPTVASVSHSAATTTTPSNPAAAGSLDSEKDRARRYAGQFMYVVVMQYVKLQLEGVVGHGVREALATGMYSVLDVTSAEGMRIMSDGMDAGGRTVFREMWKMYQRFGKWSGV